MHSSAISAFIPARLEAYGKFKSAIKAVTTGISREVAADIYEAANSAKLVASDATFAAIGTVQELVRCAEKGKHVDSDTFFSARQELLSCMRNDLSYYPVPKAQRK